ncbi:TPA: hypothetical protein ACGO0F_001334 [Streptococcus suis]
MPAVRAVDGGLCAVGAGGEVERGVGRCGSAIYGKEEGMEEIIEKHFENMVDEILITSETYEDAISSLKKISVLGIHQPGGLIKSLEIAIKRRACQQKTPNHKD